MSRRPDRLRASPLVQVSSRNGPHAVTSAQVRKRVVAMLCALDRADAELSVMLVDDAMIRSLNGKYRGIDAATDVLAFPMLEGDFAGIHPQMLGDVVISIPTAARQAKAVGQSVLAEVTHLLAHGLLHLVGYDHDTRNKRRAMMIETQRLVAAVEA